MIKVGMADYKVAKSPGLTTLGLGSCVGFACLMISPK